MGTRRIPSDIRGNFEAGSHDFEEMEPLVLSHLTRRALIKHLGKASRNDLSEHGLSEQEADALLDFLNVLKLL